MNITRFGQIVVGLVAFGMISSAWGWEPREPAGVTPLNAEQIKNTVAGQIGRGYMVAFEDRYFEDGVYRGITSNGMPYSGKWWVEKDDNYLCFTYLGKPAHCYNVARGEDGMYYYYFWGADRPDFDVKFEALPD